MSDIPQPVTLPHAPPTGWPDVRAVALLPGSLPMGGVVPDTPVHAFAHTPDLLRLDTRAALNPQRRDIDLDGLLAFEISDVITPDEADALVAASEHMGFRPEAPGIATPPGMRMNKSVHWLADAALLGPVMDRIAHLLPPRIDGRALFPQFSHRLNMYRYDDNDVFNRHTDGDWPGYSLDPQRRTMLEWRGLRSALTMVLYLNGPQDGVQGGQTRLFTRQGRAVDVTPAKGSALFFRHGFGPASVVHEGCRVSGPVPKYVARINVMYQEESA